MAEPFSHIDLPGERLGLRVLGTVIVAIYAIFTPLAIWNLISLENLIPTFLWLAIVGLTVQGFRRDGWKSGTAELLTQTFGHRFYGLTSEHLLVGFTVGGRRIIRDQIALATIKSVEWSPGQASGMAGRDMKDWSIAVWFGPGEEIERQKRAIGRDIAIIGPARPKDEVEAEGMVLVDRLRTAGVSLVHEEGAKLRVRFVVEECAT